MKKRTITPEQLAKMQEGKRKAKQHRERVAMLSELDERLKNAQRADSNIRIRPRKKRRHK